MPVVEFGEMGVLVKPYDSDKLVIHWRVRAKSTATRDSPYLGWNVGDPVYTTSMGPLKGELDKSDYFEPTPRERSLRPCIARAIDYATKKWPGYRNETH